MGSDVSCYQTEIIFTSVHYLESPLRR